MPVDTLRENDEIVRALQDAIGRGGHGLSVVPGLLKRVIRENRWQERHVDVIQRRAAFDHFGSFVMERPPEGLGATLDMLQRLCRDDREAIDLIDQTTTNPVGTNQHSNNVSTQPEGNTAQYAIRKLRKDRPDLHAQVIAGEVSPHAAMVEAGFRRPTITVPLDPILMARAICRRVSQDDWSRLKAEGDRQFGGG